MSNRQPREQRTLNDLISQLPDRQEGEDLLTALVAHSDPRELTNAIHLQQYNQATLDNPKDGLDRSKAQQLQRYSNEARAAGLLDSVMKDEASRQAAEIVNKGGAPTAETLEQLLLDVGPTGESQPYDDVLAESEIATKEAGQALIEAARQRPLTDVANDTVAERNKLTFASRLRNILLTTMASSSVTGVGMDRLLELEEEVTASGTPATVATVGAIALFSAAFSSRHYNSERYIGKRAKKKAKKKLAKQAKKRGTN